MRRITICNKLNQILETLETLDNLGNNIASRLDEGALAIKGSVQHFLPAFLKNNAIKNTIIYNDDNLILKEPSDRVITTHNLNRINNH